MNNTFFMVFVENENTPTHKHFSLNDAEIEAKRLSKLLKKKAYVLATIKSLEINEFTIEDMRPDDELPF